MQKKLLIQEMVENHRSERDSLRTNTNIQGNIFIQELGDSRTGHDVQRDPAIASCIVDGQFALSTQRKSTKPSRIRWIKTKIAFLLVPGMRRVGTFSTVESQRRQKSSIHNAFKSPERYLQSEMLL